MRGCRSSWSLGGERPSTAEPMRPRGRPTQSGGIAAALEASREKLGACPRHQQQNHRARGRLLRAPEVGEDQTHELRGAQGPESTELQRREGPGAPNLPSVHVHWGSAGRAQVPAVPAGHPLCSLSQPPTSRDSSGQGPVQGEGLGTWSPAAVGCGQHTALPLRGPGRRAGIC